MKDLEKLTAIEIITRMNKETQNQNLRLFVRVDLKTKLQILQLQKQQFHRLKNAYCNVENTVLTLSALILAINLFIKELDGINLNVIKLRGKNNKSKIKRQKLLSYWAIVKSLKLEQKMSFRDIAKYLKKYHKFTVAYSTIYAIWLEIEKNNIKIGE